MSDVNILQYTDTLVLGRALRHHVVQNKFDKLIMENDIMSWMPSQVGQAFTLWLM